MQGSGPRVRPASQRCVAGRVNPGRGVGTGGSGPARLLAAPSPTALPHAELPVSTATLAANGRSRG